MNSVPVSKLQDRSNLGFQLVPSAKEEATYQQSKDLGAHRDDHYIFFITLEGSGYTVVDFQEKTVGPNTLYYILPDQIHYRIITKKAKGWYLAADPAIVDPACRDVIESWSGFQEPLTLSAEEIKDYDMLLGILYRQAYEQESSISVLHSLLRSFFEMAAVTIQRHAKAEANNSRSAILSMQFKKLLNENIKEFKSPADYAKMLHISAPYLNEALKKTTGSTVSFWIKYKILTEAKRLLYFTDLNVKQIAEELGFDNHSYFSHIFYKETGMTALTFRRQSRERE
ncbi:AraC family transcriptional regulator [Chitinophaga sancti]|uniref:AraC family transcriptional regulator n=1 Tax=Chitinophaga sancti TaxID=1004 RepID=A0A1K1RA96_9BACT|nr:AraC family transcriptional regulator [Chitinophaga sancti]WQD65540.1 AraC family transcriptional regulator [Chitinophaga sancti]WQG88837.1 AraC family transcriptional regulator [Chitinophaga sancti]SFW69055.1 AraC-type DNA-binding protein [Chitinophaga sancti]